MDQVQPNSTQTAPQGSSVDKLLLAIFVILTIILVGLGGLLLLQTKNQKTLPNTIIPTTIILPTIKVENDQTIISPTVQPDNPVSVDVGNIETDLKDIGTDVKNLQ